MLRTELLGLIKVFYSELWSKSGVRKGRQKRGKKGVRVARK